MTSTIHDHEGPSVVGYFTYSVDDDHWTWSDGMYSLHGFLSSEVKPSTELLLAHQHPDDRADVFDVLDTAMQAATPFSCYHRVIDRHGLEHAVLLVGRGVRDDRGVVEKLEGFYVDLAPGVSTGSTVVRLSDSTSTDDLRVPKGVNFSGPRFRSG